MQSDQGISCSFTESSGADSEESVGGGGGVGRVEWVRGVPSNPSLS